MKNQVLYFNSNDDYIQVCNKIHQSREKRILIVWNSVNTSGKQKANFAMINRCIKKAGCQIAIVTDQSWVVDLANKYSIPIFSGVEDAVERPWIDPRRNVYTNNNQNSNLDNRKKTNLPMVRQYRRDYTPGDIRVPVFIIGLLSCLLVLSIFIPRAEIIIEPINDIHKITMDVWTNPSLTSVQISGMFPSEEMKIVVDFGGVVDSTGTTKISLESAQGNITMSNLTSEQITIPEGTILATLSEPPTTFLTLREKVIQAGIGNMENVPIIANQAGTSGNVPPGSILAVIGDVGDKISVINEEATKSGTDQEVRSPSATDYQRLRNEVLDKLIQTAEQKIETELDKDRIVIPGTIIINNIIVEVSEPAVGYPSEKLQIYIKAECQAWVYEVDDLKLLAQNTLALNLPKGYVPVEGSINTRNISEPFYDGTKAYWLVAAEQKVLFSYDPDYVKSLVLGKWRRKSYEILSKQLKLEVPPVVKMSPSWWPLIPFLPYQAVIRIQ